jgi:adenylyltransferase/sulfurtransferase
MLITTEEGRYDRQELISWWDQDRLRAARILVVGAGALGNEVVKNLLLIGVGHIDVIDLDIVERSNLARCVFFREDDNGSFKSEVVANGAAAINPESVVTSHVGDVTSIGLGWLLQFDLVIGALDNREARLWINQACRKLGLTWVDGAIEGIRGVVKVFPPTGACYECTLGERDREILSKRRSCSLLSTEEMLTGKVPTTATSSSVIAGLQVQEAVRLLHNQESPIANSGWIFTGETFDSYVVNYTEDEFCMSHDSYTDIGGDSLSLSHSVADALLIVASSDSPAATAIDFEREIVRGASCPGCAWNTDINRRIDTVDPTEIICPTCQEPGVIDMALSIAVDDELCLRSFESLGFPPSEIFTIRCDEQRIHFLIGGAQS